jgi:protein-L-isoaspartate(D-aspartate) O-methyltransferase
MLALKLKWSNARQRMVEDLRSRGIVDARVLGAMGRVKRDMFVPDYFVNNAYDDGPLPIGEGQTISQPYVVALMTELLLGMRTQKVLEVGTGSGYQTAVLCEIFEQVYSVERIGKLSVRAEKVLSRLCYTNFQLRIGDGIQGWLDWEKVTKGKGFDGIIVTAAGRMIPEDLRLQLAERSCLVMPVETGEGQYLIRLVKKDNRFEEENHGMVTFVPLL